MRDEFGILNALDTQMTHTLSRLFGQQARVVYKRWNGYVGQEAAGYEGGMEVLGMANVMQMVIESLNLLLQMILSLGILSLSKEIVTLSLTNLAMQKPRLTSFF